MSARMDMSLERATEPAARDSVALSVAEIEMECLIRNSDQKNLVAPLRDAHGQGGAAGSLEASQRREAVALQEKWEGWLVRRELLRNEIKRGKEILDQVRQELAETLDQLEEWPSFERICGKNPLMDYMRMLSGKERIEEFLPQWIERKESQLATLNRQMERCAKENGLEHLL